MRPAGQRLLVKIFIHGRFIGHRAVTFCLATHIYQPGTAYLRPFYPFCKFVQLLSGIPGCPLDANGPHIGGVPEDAEFRIPCKGGKIVYQHVKPNVGLVASVFFHGCLIGHAGQGSCEIQVVHLFEKMQYQPFKHRKDIVPLHKRHFAVYLCEFRLPVCPQIFIAETAHDLVILVITSYHEQLL